MLKLQTTPKTQSNLWNIVDKFYELTTNTVTSNYDSLNSRPTIADDGKACLASPANSVQSTVNPHLKTNNFENNKVYNKSQRNSAESKKIFASRLDDLKFCAFKTINF